MSPHIKGNLLSEDQNLSFRKTGRNYMNMSCGNLKKAVGFQSSLFDRVRHERLPQTGMSDYLKYDAQGRGPAPQ